MIAATSARKSTDQHIADEEQWGRMARRRPKAKGKTSVPEVVATTPVSSDQAAPSCSFCGKNQRDVRKLIHGPGVCICDECVELCQDILAPVRRIRRTKKEAKPPTKKGAPDSRTR